MIEVEDHRNMKEEHRNLPSKKQNNERTNQMSVNEQEQPRAK